MAITATNQEPGIIVPAYGRIIWSFTSDNTLQGNFKYVLDVYINGTLYTRLKQFPNPSGYCLIDLGTVAQAVLSSVNEYPTQIPIPFVPPGAPITNCPDSHCTMQLLVGEEWSVGTAAPFIYNGVTNELGDPAYATNTIQILNAYLDIDQEWDTTLNAFTPMIAPLNSNFMTDVPRSAATATYPKVRMADHYTLQYINRILPSIYARTLYADNIYGLTITLVDQDGAPMESAFVQNNVDNAGGPWVDCSTPGSWTNDQFVQRIAVGPKDLLDLGILTFVGTVGQVPTYYTIEGVSWSDYTTCDEGASLTELFRFDLVDDCNPSGFVPIQIEFLNKYGGFDYYTFTLRNEETQSTKRNLYNILPGDWSGAVFTRPTYARGSAVNSAEVTIRYTAMTDWLTQEESEWLSQLAKSTDVRAWINGQYYTVVMNSVDYVVQTYARNKLFQYTIEFTSSLTPLVQNS